NSGKISPTIMMEILRDHYGGICMHGAFRTTGSQVSYLSKKNSIHWMTGSPHPCISFFKPFIVPTQNEYANIDIFKQRDNLNLLKQENVIKVLQVYEKELIQSIQQRFQSDDWSNTEIEALTQEALNRELSLISE
ncbi:MAG: hypothetical protein ACFFDC_10935, partial [Promethearchaeota archaeon]